jgi:hypothetical protein
VTLKALAGETAWFSGCVGVTLAAMAYAIVVNGYRPVEGGLVYVARWAVTVYVATVGGRLTFWWFIVGARPDDRP